MKASSKKSTFEASSSTLETLANKYENNNSTEPDGRCPRKSENGFQLISYIRANNSPMNYTIALLDRSLVIHLIDNEMIVDEVKPFIHPSVKVDRVDIRRTEQSGVNGGYLVKLLHHRATLKSAFLTSKLFKDNEHSRNEASNWSINDVLTCDGMSRNEGNSIETENVEDLEYAASMFLFPVIDNVDQMLAFLLGNWLSLLNTTAVVSAFGLKVVASMGVVSNSTEELANIKEMITENHRQAKPKRNRGTQQKQLGKVSDFQLDDGNHTLEKIKVLPVKSWGNALLEGDDFFRFRLSSQSSKEQNSQDFQ
jgi:hypothetical protein